MPDTFDKLIDALDKLEKKITTAAIRGAKQGARAMEADAKASTSYNDQTGATRAGTVAYVASAQDDGSALVGGAAALVEAANPGQSVVENVGALPPDTIMIVLTVPTRYQKDLETRRAGEKATLGPTMVHHAPLLTEAIVQEIARELR